MKVCEMFLPISLQAFGSSLNWLFTLPFNSHQQFNKRNKIQAYSFVERDSNGKEKTINWYAYLGSGWFYRFWLHEDPEKENKMDKKIQIEDEKSETLDFLKQTIPFQCNI